MNGLFRKPSIPVLNQAREADFTHGAKKVSPTFSNSSTDDRSGNALFTATSKETATSRSDDQSATTSKGSVTLREQIARAKAAKRATTSKPSSSNFENEVPVVPTATFDFGLPQDPFNQKVDPDGIKGVLRKRIDAARADGRLNIAALSLKAMPEEVMNMYSLESISAGNGSWAESVDLTRFVAADNEFEELGDDVFPDIDPRAALDDHDEAEGNQFGGLETLDLHGNLLKTVPVGLRRLELLTTLNLVSLYG